MNRLKLACFVTLSLGVTALAQRSWIVYPTSDVGGDWTDVADGDYQNQPYRYATSFDGVRRAYWDLTTEHVFVDPDSVTPHNDPFPVKPALYYVDQWVPVPPGEVANWGWLPIEVTWDGPGSGEEASGNIFVPWNGAYGTNHQWAGLDQRAASYGTWERSAFDEFGNPAGPQCPSTPACESPGWNGRYMWLKRGSTLYTKWNFAFAPRTHAITAIRLVEAFEPAGATCTAATAAGGPLDLRCIGNADPLYMLNEPFSNSAQRPQQTTSIDGQNALAVTNYSVQICLDPGFPYNVPLTPGLPASEQYTAQLPFGNVLYQLHYDGLNSIKWVSGDIGGEFDRNRVFSLNGTPGQEFAPGQYDRIYLLTASSGSALGTLDVEAVYGDSSTSTTSVNLYDWSGQDGDANSIAVGVDGVMRTQGGIGFEWLNKNGESVNDHNGGNTNGLFLMAHPIELDGCKTLASINLSFSLPTPPPFIVESQPGGENYANFSSTGSWTQDSHKSKADGTTAGIGSLYAAVGQGGTTAVYSFTPTETTYYDVAATWVRKIDPPDPNAFDPQACEQARHVITHAGGSTVVTVNQRDDGDGWRGLGGYLLQAGVTYTVTQDVAGSTGGSKFWADGVRWQPTGISSTVVAASLEAGQCCPVPWADVDGDMDVDVEDYGVFQACMTLDGSAIRSGCECFDVDGGGAIDVNDLVDFINCSMGAGVEFEHVGSTWPNWPVACTGKPLQ